MSLDNASSFSSSLIRRGAFILCGALLAKVCTSYLISLRKAMRQQKIEAIGKEFLASRDSRIKSLIIPLPDLPMDLLERVPNASISELRAFLIQGQLKSEDLVNIFSRRCQTIGLELYAITEMDYENAIQQARECDKLLQSYITNPYSLTVKEPTNRSESFTSFTSSRNRSDSQSTQASTTQKSRYRSYSFASDKEDSFKDDSDTTDEQHDDIVQPPRTLSELFNQRPLLGIPVSIKDTFEMKGFACTTGCIERKDLICSEDGLILKLIRQAGGIPFVRTNVPQLGMSIECMNRLYGRSLNPWDRTRYPGGSSGGEAILLATRCSPLGLGTDFGGSVRTPACINGISAFKPTNGRVPQKGLGISASTSIGQLVMRTTLGPMAKYVDDLIISMRVLLNSEFVEKQAISMRGAYQQIAEFDECQLNDKKRKFKIAYFKSLDYFEACQAQQRAVQTAVEAMVARGHEVVEIEFPFANQLNRIYYQIISSDNNAKYSDILGEEDYVEEYSGLKYFMTEASPLTKHSIMLLLRFFKQNRSADVIEWCKVNRSAEEFMAINGELVKLRDEVIEFLESQNIDAIISPALGVPAFEHGSSPKFILCIIYSLIWNVLNFPSGVVPVTTIRSDEQHYHSKISDNITKEINLRMMNNTAGLPIGVQVSSYPYKDEICLNIMEQIEKDIDFYSTTKLPM